MCSQRLFWHRTSRKDLVQVRFLSYHVQRKMKASLYGWRRFDNKRGPKIVRVRLYPWEFADISGIVCLFVFSWSAETLLNFLKWKLVHFYKSVERDQQSKNTKLYAREAGRRANDFTSSRDIGSHLFHLVLASCPHCTMRIRQSNPRYDDAWTHCTGSTSIAKTLNDRF